MLPDGSRTTGQTTFTRSNGTTGTVADAELLYDARGHAVTQTVTVSNNGATTITNKLLNPNGSLAGNVTRTTSADGNTTTQTMDRNGDHVMIGWTAASHSRNRKPSSMSGSPRRFPSPPRLFMKILNDGAPESRT